MFISYQQLDNIGIDITVGLSSTDLITKHCLTQVYLDKLRAEINPRSHRYWIVAELLKLYNVVEFLRTDCDPEI